MEINDAVTAIIKAKVAEALVGGEGGIIERLVSASLDKQIEVPDPERGYYAKKKIAFLDHVLAESIQNAAARAVRDIVAERFDEIKELIKQSMEPKIEKLSTAIVERFAREDDWAMGLNLKFKTSSDD